MRTRLFMMVALLCTMFLPQFLHAQNKTISGKITDVGGNPIPGATVVINRNSYPGYRVTSGIGDLTGNGFVLCIQKLREDHCA